MDIIATLPGEDAAHPDGQYGAVAKWFHWVTVGLIAIGLPVGFVIKYITEAQEGAVKYVFYTIHEGAGVTVFAVTVLRLLWKATHPAPPYPPELPAAMRIGATAVHHALYTLLIVQPLLGFFATNAWGFPLRGKTAYLGFIDLPEFMAASEGLAQWLQLFHTIGGWLFLVLLVVHVGAAVFHHAIRRDGTLMRML